MMMQYSSMIGLIANLYGFGIAIDNEKNYLELFEFFYENSQDPVIFKTKITGWLYSLNVMLPL